MRSYLIAATILALSVTPGFAYNNDTGVLKISGRLIAPVSVAISGPLRAPDLMPGQDFHIQCKNNTSCPTIRVTGEAGYHVSIDVSDIQNLPDGMSGHVICEDTVRTGSELSCSVSLATESWAKPQAYQGQVSITAIYD